MNSAYRIAPRSASLSTVLVAGLLTVSLPDPAIADNTAPYDYRRGADHGYEHERSQHRRDHDRQGRHSQHHDYRGGEVDIIIDGLRIGEHHQPTISSRDERPQQGEPDICHKATSTRWSTRSQECPGPQPKERSQRWSTSPD